MKLDGLATLILSFGLILGAAGPGRADDVLVTPGSIIFDDGTRAAQLLVANIGDATSVFQLRPTFFTMNADGSLTEVTGAQPRNSATNMVRFSPRQFELKPGESQLVRLATRLPATLAAGEYRFHLRVTDVGKAVAKVAPSAPDAVQAEIRIQVTRAVRILIRHGVGAGRATTENLAATHAAGGAVNVTFDLHRTGAGSSQGEYALFARRGANGAKTADLVDRGVLVYAELAKRQIAEAFPSDALKGGSEVCVTYTDKSAGPGKGTEEHCVPVGI